MWIGAVTIAARLAALRPARPRCSMQRAAAAPARASTRPSGASTRSARQAVDLQHRHAVRRQRRRVGRARRSAPPAAGRRSSAAARRITATSPTTNAARAPRPSGTGGDDLRADAAGVAHRQRRAAGGVRSKPCAHCRSATRARDNARPTSAPLRPTIDAQGLAPLLAGGDRRGRAAVRRRDAEAEWLQRGAEPRRRAPPRRVVPLPAPVQSVSLIGPGTAADELQRRRQARLAGGRQHHRQPAPRAAAAQRRSDVPLLLRRPRAPGAARSARSASARA